MNTTLIIGLIALAVILVVIGYFLLRKALREQEPELAKFDENPLDAFVETEGEDPVKHEEECKQTACDIMEAGNIICEEANKPEPMVELEPTYTMTEELAGKVLDKVEDTPKAVVTGENETTEVTEEEIEKISDEDLKNIAKALKPAKKSTDKKRSRKEKTNDTKKKTEKTVKPSKSTPKKTKPRQNEAVNGKKNKKKPAKKNSKKK